MMQIKVGDVVRHKELGLGDVTAVSQDRIEAEFAAVKRSFIYSEIFENGKMSLYQDGKQFDRIKRIPVVFFNIAWMKHYKGVTAKDKPINGGKHVDETGECAESEMCIPISMVDEKTSIREKFLLGYVSSNFKTDNSMCQLKIERIVNGFADDRDWSVERVLVIWCAKPKEGPNHVVGFFKDAEVYREHLFYEDGQSERCFITKCPMKNAVLLPVNQRTLPEWRIPRSGKEGAAFGFGKSNIWYADTPKAERFVKRMILSVGGYRGANAARR